MKRKVVGNESNWQFAGHETFPLRLLWLKKVADAVRDGMPSGTFQEHDAIARFGVGRNMAQSMRHWALASGFFVEDGDRFTRPTALGRLILPDDGFDPYVERAATVWLAHWHVASTAEKTTTIYYAFNALAAIEFDPETLVEELVRLTDGRHRATRVTLKRDVEVFLRSYVRRGDAQSEDAAEPLLAELGLVREARLGGWYEFVRGAKPSLPAGVFAYALGHFWEGQGGSTALTAEQICYAPGSPGRVFKLDEDSVITRLMGLKDLTDGAWQWTDTAGLRQVHRNRDYDTLPLLAFDYGREPSFARAA